MRQIYRYIDRDTDGYKERERVDRETDTMRPIHRQIQRETDRERETATERDRDREKERECRQTQ